MAEFYRRTSLPLTTFLWPWGKVMAAPPALAKPHTKNTGCWGTGKLFIFDLSASLKLLKPRQRQQTTGQQIHWGVLQEDGVSELGVGFGRGWQKNQRASECVRKLESLRKHFWVTYNLLLLSRMELATASREGKTQITDKLCIQHLQI